DREAKTMCAGRPLGVLETQAEAISAAGRAVHAGYGRRDRPLHVYGEVQGSDKMRERTCSDLRPRPTVDHSLQRDRPLDQTLAARVLGCDPECRRELLVERRQIRLGSGRRACWLANPERWGGGGRGRAD